MELGKVQYFEKVENPNQREFINAHNNCILCGTVLELQHIRTADTSLIKEEVTVEYETGYWLVLILFVIVAVTNMYTFIQQKRTPKMKISESLPDRW